METILIVDDTKLNLQILTQLLEQNYDLIVCKDGKSAIELAHEEEPHLILLDIVMPDMDGFEVCKKLKSTDKTKDIPIIFISAKSDENIIEMAYDLGGSDYVTKPFRPKELKARVKRELKLLKLQNELNVLASTDSLTQLYNRRYFSKVSKHICDLARRDKKSLSLIMLDIDDFKNINDSYGHNIGDEVIVKFAQILQQEQRESDIICRFGGEEFVILLPETNILSAQKVAEKIRLGTQELSMEIENQQSLQFTISIGVSSVVIENEYDLEQTISRADKALYRAKKSGKNRVCFL